MIRLPLWSLAALALACGGVEAPRSPDGDGSDTAQPTPTSTLATATGTATTTATAPAPPPDFMMACARSTSDCETLAPERASWPASFAAAAGAGACGVAPKTQAAPCSYPEGVCTCETTPYCGGVRPTAWQERGMSWKCKATPKPGECPLQFAAGRCDVAGQKCTRSTCAGSSACTCVGGSWRCTMTRNPPVP
jgi:hypothetical protein